LERKKVKFIMSPKSENQQRQFVTYAVLAGFFGAMSGVVGKLSVTAQMEVFVLFRVLFFASNIYATGQMWRFYLKALSLGPTAMAQTMNTATNFAVSALSGVLIFGEQISLLWCVGAAMCAAGLVLTVSSQKSAKGEE
jgi:uncharacterized membrane protein